MAKENILVLCIDRDDDLGKKAGVTGPVIGRQANIQAATNLLLKDPEDTDANAMFQAVKIYDEVIKSKKAEVVTITGDSRLGYHADKKIVTQLESILQQFHATSCIFVTDGADDEELLPLISSRIKLDSKKTVVMKQAKELEKTYVTLLSKLKEPYYAKLFFGIPALILISFLISDMLGYGWRPIVGIVGMYLLLKGFGIEDFLINTVRNLLSPSTRTALVVYVPIIALALISISIGVSEFVNAASNGYSFFESLSFGIRPILWPFAVFIIILIIIGRAIELYPKGSWFELIDTGLSSVNGIIVSLLAYLALSWVVGEAWFYEFLIAMFVSIILTLIATEFARSLKIRVAAKIRLEGKEIITDIGAYIGKIIGIDKRAGTAIAQTPIGTKIPIKLERISSVGERVIVKQ
ncbi:MAG: DUF373 family protein [Candidatus Micrarchaeota archaeon]|nr:DUF373 family protein [Candidatus Micrarchaeota archaeon]